VLILDEKNNSWSSFIFLSPHIFDILTGI